MRAKTKLATPVDGVGARGVKRQKNRLGGRERRKRLRENYPFLVMLLPAAIVVFLFSYLPIYGILIAFQDFMPGDKIFSDSTIWVGVKNFTRFFTDVQFWPLMKNTFLLCIMGFIIGFPLPILVALMLNALKGRKGAKWLQTIFTAPHFISLVVLVGMLQIFFGRYGLVNNVAANLGFERYSYFLESSAFRPFYILSSNWQDFGWSAVIYIAALSNVDPQQHEAAIMDGASRFQRIRYVDFPAILPMVSVMLIMSIGGLMGVGYEKALLMQTDGNLAVSELIATYVYKRGLTGVPDQAYATAIGLFNSVINVILLIIANKTSKKFSQNSLW
ncbi:MAG: ABC transporter permease subunit [Lachnospiraceae bacterium]|nr:ABC transporter permease subunit [Lachnospiraceae bacterium]